MNVHAIASERLSRPSLFRSIFLAVIAAVVMASGAYAQSDAMTTLENHQPEKQGVLQGMGAGGDTAQASSAISADVYASFIERINTLFAKLNSLASRVNELLDRLAKAKANGSTSSSGTTPSSGASGTTGSSTSSSTSSAVSAEASAALAAWKGGKLSPDKFSALFGPIAHASFLATGVPASVTLAQAALETGWGAHTIKDGKNLFGIKGKGPAGSVTVSTKEYVNGKYITINAAFRKYNTWQESIDDHARLLSEGKRYKNCMKYSNNPDQFAREVQKAGYATSPTYAQSLINLMKKYDFYKWDK